MSTATRDPRVAHRIPTAAPTAAVVWIDATHALLACSRSDGGVLTDAITREPGPESRYLATVVDAIGDRDRVVILGPGSERLALEREYVAIHQRPDRLVDVEPSTIADRAELLARLRQLES